MNKKVFCVAIAANGSGYGSLDGTISDVESCSGDHQLHTSEIYLHIASYFAGRSVTWGKGALCG